MKDLLVTLALTALLVLLTGCSVCSPWLTNEEEDLTLGVQCEWEF